MNKTIVIAGGAAVASLAAGAASGYFFAYKKLGKEFDARLETELAAAERSYALRLMAAKEKKPTIEELAARNAAAEHEEETPSDDEPSDDEILKAEAEKALTDYRGLSAKASKNGSTGEKPASTSIFDDRKKPKLPPRDEESGRFLPRQSVEEPQGFPAEPQLITDEDFIVNEYEHDQELLRYYINDDTLVDPTTEQIEEFDVKIVGRDNLKTLVDKESGEAIFVRNYGLKTDYQITRIDESLAGAVGLGDSDDESRYL